tara:strand:+ start:290 stop:832 length:543 start_codon:yes stop_codon:yes gene_type:complete
MTIRKILRMGHPTLRQKARQVTIEELKAPEFTELISDMIETLHNSGGIGLAAPQIDVPIRMAIIEIQGGDSRYGVIPSIPMTVFINPTIEVISPTEMGYWEGCLSIPGLRGFVERPQGIRVDALNRHGEQISMELNGFLATVFQHEFDHLDGKLYIDYIQNRELLVFEEEYEQFILNREG